MITKREQARESFHTWIRMAWAGDPEDIWPRGHSEEVLAVVDSIIDAAKEEIRAELKAEQEAQDEERRWKSLNDHIETYRDGPISATFAAEWRALKAKREAAGKTCE